LSSAWRDSVGRALPAISFLGSTGILPVPAQARAPANLLISWTNKSEFPRGLSLEPELKLDKFPDDCRFPEDLLSF
jgi:hypothetical protein